MQTLTFNCGSSSIKFALFAESRGVPRCSGKIDRIGQGNTILVFSEYGEKAVRVPITGQTFDDVLPVLFEKVQPFIDSAMPLTVTHRVVFGGPYTEHMVITDTLLRDLSQHEVLFPQHLPQQVKTIHESMKRMPQAVHLACFDTVFHAQMPIVARTLPLPLRFQDTYTRRYGYHGLAYESVVHALRPFGTLPERVICAHLGSGSSVCAIRDGVSVETSMGFSPSGGTLFMGTRYGDIDPGLLEYVCTTHNISLTDAVRALTNEAGLSALSHTSPHMRDVLDRYTVSTDAKLAVDAFCYTVAKTIGAYIAVLGGCDALCFSGGIGEQSSQVREQICSYLSYLGLQLDSDANQAHSTHCSTNTSPVSVYVIIADEERAMAEIAHKILQK